MEDLSINLSKNEFSTGRKILLWIVATLFLGIGIWDLYLNLVKHDTSVNAGLTVVLFTISVFMYFIALLATLKRKEHYFKITNNSISYRYGLLFPKHHDHSWEKIEKVRIPKDAKKTILVLKTGKDEHINLTWVEKNNARIIRRHIYYSAKKRSIPIIRK